MILRVRSVGGCKCRVQIVTTIELQRGLCGSCVAAAAEHCRLVCLCGDDDVRKTSYMCSKQCDGQGYSLGSCLM